MFLLYHFFIDSLNTCNRADQSSTVKDDGWTLQSHIQIYESENGSLKKKRRVELPPQCKVKKKPHTALHSPSHSLISISFSRRLRSQICCLFPRGEAARAESPSVSQPRHPSTLNPSSPPHPLAPSLPPSLPLPRILVCHHLSDARLPPSHQLCLCPTVKWNFEWTSNVWNGWNVKKVHFHWWVRSKLSLENYFQENCTYWNDYSSRWPRENESVTSFFRPFPFSTNFNSRRLFTNSSLLSKNTHRHTLR